MDDVKFGVFVVGEVDDVFFFEVFDCFFVDVGDVGLFFLWYKLFDCGVEFIVDFV